MSINGKVSHLLIIMLITVLLSPTAGELFTPNTILLHILTLFQNCCFKGILHPKMKMVIYLLPPFRSETIKASFVFRTQFKIFWMRTGRLVTRVAKSWKMSSKFQTLSSFREFTGNCSIDCQVNNTVKVQKSMKNNAKILHPPSVVQS